MKKEFSERNYLKFYHVSAIIPWVLTFTSSDRKLVLFRTELYIKPRLKLWIKIEINKKVIFTPKSFLLRSVRCTATDLCSRPRASNSIEISLISTNEWISPKTGKKSKQRNFLEILSCGIKARLVGFIKKCIKSGKALINSVNHLGFLKIDIRKKIIRF